MLNRTVCRELQRLVQRVPSMYSAGVFISIRVGGECPPNHSYDLDYLLQLRNIPPYGVITAMLSTA
jgi:hypothetical protein